MRKVPNSAWLTKRRDEYLFIFAMSMESVFFLQMSLAICYDRSAEITSLHDFLSETNRILLDFNVFHIEREKKQLLRNLDF